MTPKTSIPRHDRAIEATDGAPLLAGGAAGLQHRFRCTRRPAGQVIGSRGGDEGPMRRSQAGGSGRGIIAAAMMLAAAPLLGGCFTQTYYHGYVVQDGALEQIPIGATQEQVLIVLGTPSTVATVNGEVFYYISERAEKTAFLPQKVVNQRVIAVYFDKNRRVERLADYGLQDGRIFDFVSRTTPTTGKELNYLTYVFKIFGKE
jgi:outer membrane protein assembly factor BamE (lipoprotein component of BamABCDE complex)